MKVTHADFVKSATKPEHYPPPDLPEIAFAGKSNVGKSSLINRLVNRKKLAKTSSTPGRTQLINFFTINGKISFVDLPGYGYAKVPREIQRQWKPMVEAYLSSRENLALAVVIVDIRRDVAADDMALLDWLGHYGIPFLLVLTKADKLSKNQGLKRRAGIKKAVGLDDDHLVLFSAQTGEGKDDLWKKIASVVRDR
jgi:GTP-binding protein